MILASIEESTGNSVFSFESDEGKSKFLFIIFLSCTTILFSSYLIILIICLYYHYEYIKDFMNDINLDFQRDKNDYKWNIIVIIFLILTLLYIFFYKKIKKKFEFYETTNEDNTEEIGDKNNNSHENNNAQDGEKIIKYNGNPNTETMNSIDRINKQNDQRDEESSAEKKKP